MVQATQFDRHAESDLHVVSQVSAQSADGIEMSSAANSFASHSISLIKEYTQKFVQIRTEVTNLRNQVNQPPVNQPHIAEQRRVLLEQLQHQASLFAPLDQALQNLISTAAKRINDGGMDDWLEAELLVRMADLQREQTLTRQYLSI